MELAVDRGDAAGRRSSAIAEFELELKRTINRRRHRLCARHEGLPSRHFRTKLDGLGIGSPWSSPSASRYPRSDLDRELAAGSTLAVSGQSEGQPSDPGRRLYGLDVLGARLKRAICRSFLHQAVLAAIRRSGRNKSGVTANSRRGAI